MAASATTTAVIRAAAHTPVRAPLGRATRHSRHRSIFRRSRSPLSPGRLRSGCSWRFVLAIPLLVLAAAGRDLPGTAAVRLHAAERRRDGLLRRGARADLGRIRPGLCRGAAAARGGSVSPSGGCDGAGCVDPGWLSWASRWRPVCSCSTKQTTGAAVVGWPLLWSVTLFPFRVARPARRRRSRSRSGCCSRSPRTRLPSSRPRTSACARRAAARSASQRRRSSRSGRC